MQTAVKDRYAAASKAVEEALCCPVSYNQKYLKIIPQEVIDRDYGCGDPSAYVKEGDVVLDLGSGGGKICFIASQVVGKKGKVIGVDMTDDMLELAKNNQPIVAEKLGYDNVEFRHGYIQDLKLDLDLLNDYLQKHPVSTATELKAMHEYSEKIKKEQPLIADNSIDIIVSNCVLNLVSDDLKKQLFLEMFRVLKVGGRIAISDIVSDEVSPQHMKDDEDLWSGCLTGALQEAEFLNLLEEVGFHGISIDKYDEKPWRVVEGIEYRSVTVTAWKGKQGPCIEKNHAVIYKGPWKEVMDDDNHVYHRGERMAVCEKTYKIMTSQDYAGSIIPVPAHKEVSSEENFDCSQSVIRSAKETKRGVKPVTKEVGEDCDTGACC
jgi:arsenite methyltransferase